MEWKANSPESNIYCHQNFSLLLLKQHPCQVEQEQQYGWACFSGPLSVTLQTDRGGYCPGESIAVSAFINNQSSSRLCGVEIILFQVSVYTIKTGKCQVIQDCQLSFSGSLENKLMNIGIFAKSSGLTCTCIPKVSKVHMKNPIEFCCFGR